MDFLISVQSYEDHLENSKGRIAKKAVEGASVWGGSAQKIGNRHDRDVQKSDLEDETGGGSAKRR